MRELESSCSATTHWRRVKERKPGSYSKRTSGTLKLCSPRSFSKQIHFSEYFIFCIEIFKLLLRVRDENKKLRYEHILIKKVKDLEVLSSSLVMKERELLVKYKDRLEDQDLEENN